ncbi:GNAT family N-acetyltransferase [Cytophagaceae bacterium YF14B1]|uniref:GNAT family N-acetyltransferase n=1 Tax=Xanthocytophaga flava TaxID=3048013 RepID=A0AAE3UAI9_9BACT|nr:GNAT family N-acetyltransferase [Xanthocytophaga flavus]MDJ1486179.1 GNAT family N-acetyltransferase [Xanthocytophaga flavus]
MSYHFRICQLEDIDALLILCQEHAEYEQTNYKLEGKKEVFQKLLSLENPPLHCWIVEDGREIIGYFTYTFDFSTWDAGYFLHLDCLYLKPFCRGKGIGYSIMQWLKKIAVERSCVNIQWQTPVFNENAIRFYKCIGGKGKEKVRFSLSI